MFDCNIIERIAVLSETAGGTTLELNKVAFGNNPPKLDLRKWYQGKPQKGVTLTEEEANCLLSALNGLLSASSLQVEGKPIE